MILLSITFYFFRPPNKNTRRFNMLIAEELIIRTQNSNKNTTSKYPTISPLAKDGVALLENAFEFRRALGPFHLLPA